MSVLGAQTPPVAAAAAVAAVAATMAAVCCSCAYIAGVTRHTDMLAVAGTLQVGAAYATAKKHPQG